jgi:hypothetical protein
MQEMFGETGFYAVVFVQELQQQIMVSTKRKGSLVQEQ